MLLAGWNDFRITACVTSKIFSRSPEARWQWDDWYHLLGVPGVALCFNKKWQDPNEMQYSTVLCLKSLKPYGYVVFMGIIMIHIMTTDSTDSSANCAKVPGKRCISGHSLCAANCFSSSKTIETHLRKVGFTVDSLRINENSENFEGPRKNSCKQMCWLK